jgi:isoamyl acetate esterase
MVKSPSSEWYSPETRIIVLTPPPVNTHQWVEFLRTCDTPRDTSDREVARTKAYANAAVEAAKAEGVPCLDVFQLLWDNAHGQEQNLEEFLTDGLHLKEQAYKVILSICMCLSSN